MVVEVGLKLDKALIYYHDMLIKHGLKPYFACVTHDIYYTDKDLNGKSEKEMKDSCIRLRFCDGINKDSMDNEGLKKEEDELIKKGYKKVFDTIKFDFQYDHETMKSKVQLQDIKDVGLLVYYDNPDYYDLPLDEQRKKLIDELNSYGFNFTYDTPGVDKLRTLYYQEEMYSENQNA